MNHVRKNKILDFIIILLGIFIGFLVIFPLVFSIFSAFKAKNEFGFPAEILPASFRYLDNFTQVLAQAPFHRFIINSFVMAFLGATLRILVVGLGAYAIVFYEFKGKNFIFFLLLATMMMPGEIFIITNYLTISQARLMDTYIGMVLPFIIGASQLFMLHQNFKMIPIELKEAALLDGCGDFNFIRHVVFSISRPILAILYVQSFISFFNSYLWPLMITNQTNMRTIQVGLSLLSNPENENYGLIMAGVTIVLIPSLVLLVLLRRTIHKTDITDIFI